MLQPIRLEVRQRFTIVDLRASSKLEIEALMGFMMVICYYAGNLGGRLIPLDEGNKTAEENTIHYSIIFKNYEDATRYVKFLENSQ